MGLDSILYIMYGYRLEGSPISNKLRTLYDNKEITAEEHDNLYDSLICEDDNHFMLCDDSMCGEYEYLGICLYSSSSDYGEDNHIGFEMNELRKLADEELLDKCIQEKLPWLVGDEYDICSLMNGELPKLWVFKKVW